MNVEEQVLLSTINIPKEEVNEIQYSGDTVIVTTTSKKEICPYCGSGSCKSKGMYSKKVKSSNNLFKSYNIILKVRRYTCTNCNKTFSIDKHVSPKLSGISYGSITDIMKLLQDPKMTIRQISKITNISETTMTRIFDKHCHISRVSFPEAMCIDEVYTKNSDYKAKYSCVFYDFINHTIVDVLPDRKKQYLNYYFQPLQKSEELNNVKYICIDMYLPYKQIAQRYFKKATICVDSFHVIKLLNDGLSKIRIRIMKSFPTNSQEYYLLKTFKHLLFKSYNELDINHKRKYNKVFDRYLNYYQLRELLLDIHPDLRIGYDLKEAYMDFNRECSYEQAHSLLDEITTKFINANINEYNDFLTSITNWHDEIINSFVKYKGRRINNGVAESLNAQIKLLLYNTRGIRNHERRRKRIMYAINKSGFTIK